MAENINEQQPSGQAPDANTTPPTTPQQQPPTAAPKVEELHPDIQKLIKELRSENAGHRTKAKETEAQAATAEEARLKEQNDWKTLAERSEARTKELETQVARRDREALVAKVATANKLPPELADRLVGKDEAELEADAKKLAKLVTPAPAQPGNGRGPKPAPNNGQPNFGTIRVKI